MKLNRIITGDCRRVLDDCPSDYFHLIFCDPPFNIGYEYDIHDDKMSYEDYLKWTGRWFRDVVRVLHPRGSLFVAIGDDFAAEMKLGMDTHLTRRNWIIWRYSFGQNCRKKFNRCHTHIFYYVNDAKRFTFNRESILVPSARLTKYNDKRAAAGGKLPDDVWNFPRVCGTFRERTGHPCQMPESVLSRIVRVASNPGDRVLDPFSGSGTTCAVAKKLGRRFLGIELSKRYAALSRKRLETIDADNREMIDAEGA